MAIAERDVITDFQIGVDDLRFVDFAGGTLGAIGARAFTAANQLRWVARGCNTTVFLNADADASAEMALTLTYVTGLQATDFVLWPLRKTQELRSREFPRGCGRP